MIQIINLSNIKITPDLDSVYREKISDEEYFSSKYSDYISNSRLGLINPEQGGSPNKYWLNESKKSDSLNLGSFIHNLILQPESFYLVEDVEKPTSKLGLVIDQIKFFRNEGFKIIDAIIHACNIVHYYENKITTNRIKKIISEGLLYYFQMDKYKDDSSALIPTTKEKRIAQSCVNNLKDNRPVQNLLHPIDVWGDEILTFNEDAFFMNFVAEHENNLCVLKFKMKADNWTIDLENKIITLNDLKTTSHKVDQFMNNSFYHYHYQRQFALYLFVILQYCKKIYGYNNDEWSYKCNVIVSETIGMNDCAIFPIKQELLDQGRKEFCKLLKMVAYCEMYGYSNEYQFE